jgi:hypothetical protein
MEEGTNSSPTSIGHNNVVTSNYTDHYPSGDPLERGEKEGDEDANSIIMDREQLERGREELRSGWKREPLKAFPREISPHKIFSLPGEEILWAREIPTANALLSTHGGTGSTSGEYFVLVLLALPIVSIMSIGMLIYLVFGQPQLRFMQVLGFIFLPVAGLLIWWQLMKTHVFSTKIDVITNRRVANLNIQRTSTSHLLAFISKLSSSSSSSFFSSSSSSPLLRIQLNFLPLLCIKEVVTLCGSGIRFSAHRDPSIRRENVPLLSRDHDSAATSLHLENQGDDDDEEVRRGSPPSLTEFLTKRSSTSSSRSNAVRLSDETSKFLTGSIWFAWVRSPEELKTKISEEVDSLTSQRQHPNMLSSSSTSPSPFSSSSSSAVSSSTFTTPSAFGFQDTIPLSISSLPPAYQRTCDPILKEKDVMGLLWASRPLRLLRWLSTFNFTHLAIFCFSFSFTTLWLFFYFITHLSHSTSTPSDSSLGSSSSTPASSSESPILWTIVCAFLSIGTNSLFPSSLLPLS